MSYSFQLRDGDGWLWSPSNGPGRTYVGVARLIASEDGLPNLETWLEEWTPDDYWVDPDGLSVFLRKVLDSSVFENTAFFALACGFLEYSLAMLFRAGGDVVAKNERQADLIEAARDIERRLLG